MSNTGMKAYQNRRRLINGVPDGYTEPNVPNSGLGPYFPPVQDLIACPISTGGENMPCITPILLSVTIDSNNHVILTWNLNGSTPNAVTVQWWPLGGSVINSTGSPISPRDMGPKSNFPTDTTIFFKIQSVCATGLYSNWSDTLSIYISSTGG